MPLSSKAGNLHHAPREYLATLQLINRTREPAEGGPVLDRKRLLFGLLALVAAGSVSTPGRAFDVDGYRSGMTYGRVAQVAAASGYVMYQTSNEPFDEWEIRSTPDGEAVFIISFCQGVLELLSREVASGFNAFADLAASLTAALGPPVAVTSQTRPATEGPRSTLELHFDVAGGESRGLSAQEQADGSLRVTTFWRSRGHDEECPR